MSKEQIEEIRKDIFAAFGGYAKWEEDWQSLAEAVYNAGYRKQSEGSSARGEWVYSEIYCTYICSECEECASVDDFREPRLTNFCPNCGARMSGGKK